ncbi:MAG: TetR/AcrR family transcriptional regulator [Pseudanabaena sp.]
MTDNASVATKKRSLTRESLLNAAGAVVLRLGADALTLEAVAKEAGVSKGGLLYHFPSKDSLLTSIVENLIEQFEKSLEIEIAREGNPSVKGAWLRAFIRASDLFDRQNAAIQSGLLAAIAKHSKLVQPVQEASKRWQQKAYNCGIIPLKASIILLAMDGLSLNQLLSISTIDDQERSQVVAELIRMTYSDD